MNKNEENEVPVLTARNIRNTWLVQRLQKPFPSDSPFAKVQFVTCRKGQEGAYRRGGAEGRGMQKEGRGRDGPEEEEAALLL